MPTHFGDMIFFPQLMASQANLFCRFQHAPEVPLCLGCHPLGNPKQELPKESFIYLGQTKGPKGRLSGELASLSSSVLDFPDQGVGECSASTRGVSLLLKQLALLHCVFRTAAHTWVLQCCHISFPGSRETTSSRQEWFKILCSCTCALLSHILHSWLQGQVHSIPGMSYQSRHLPPSQDDTQN